MAEDLAAPGLADQLIMVHDAAMGVEGATRDERDDEMFMTQADQEGQVTRLGVSGI